MKNCLLIVMGLMLIVGCASTPPTKMPTTPIVQAKEVVEPVVKTVVVPVPYAQPMPAQAVIYPKAGPTKAQIEAAKKDKKSTAQILDQANKNAKQTPKSDKYVNSIQIYDYMPGALYQIWGAPNHVTVISFGAGETVYGASTGDSIRWQFERTYTGSGPTRKSILLVQPMQKGLHTSLVVTTSVGTYHFELRSYQHSWMAAVQFKYPHLRLKRYAQAIKKQNKQAAARKRKSAPALSVNLAAMDSNYRFIVKGDRPAWMPSRVFHDGKKTYIEFSQNIASGRRPALFLLSKGKKAQLVQYIVRGRYYIIAHKVSLAVLKMGEDSVGIEYRGGK